MDNLPRRFGPATGRANERKMLEETQGADNIRTRVQTNGDGSVTTLRTRAGFPEFVTVRNDASEKILPVCAAIPVADTGTWGFKRNGELSPPFEAFSYGVEEKGASAELDVGKTTIRYDYNQRYVTANTKTRDNLHPGNKTWIDPRTEDRATGKVVSWWCPFTSTLPLSFCWFSPDQPWLGNAGVMAQRTTRAAQPGKDLNGTWVNCKGFVFVDGIKKANFTDHVWCAAFDAENNRLLAVTTEIIEVGSSSFIATSAFKLKQHDFSTGAVTTLHDLAGAWAGVERSPMPVFNHDATELLIALNIPADYNPTIYRVSVATGVATLETTVVTETFGGGGQWDISTILAMRYAADNTSLLYAKENALQPSTGNYGFEVDIEGTVVATSTGYDENLVAGGTNPFAGTITGDLCRIIAADGHGGYLLGYREDFTLAASNDQFGGTSSWSISHPGVQYTRSIVGGSAGYSFHNTTDLPIYFMKAGQVFSNWIPFNTATLPMTVNWGFTSFPRTMTTWWIDANSNEAALGGPNQRELSISLARSPDGRRHIIGMHFVGGTTHEFNASGGIDTYAVYTSFSEFKLIADDVATALAFPWSTSFPALNSPVFYARRGRIVKEQQS